MINEFIYGTPKPQPRPRAFVRGNRASVYNPKSANEWKRAIALGLHRFHGMKETAVFHVELSFFFERPKSHFGTGKNANLLKSTASKKHNQKPDLDNLMKAPLDVLSNINFWIDDSQVVSSTITKAWADKYPSGMLILATKLIDE